MDTKEPAHIIEESPSEFFCRNFSEEYYEMVSEYGIIVLDEACRRALESGEQKIAAVKEAAEEILEEDGKKKSRRSDVIDKARLHGEDSELYDFICGIYGCDVKQGDFDGFNMIRSKGYSLSEIKKCIAQLPDDKKRAYPYILSVLERKSIRKPREYPTTVKRGRKAQGEQLILGLDETESNMWPPELSSPAVFAALYRKEKSQIDDPFNQYHYQSAVVDDINAWINDPDSRGLGLNPVTSFGKTHCVAIILHYCNSIGKRLIYMAPNRSNLLDTVERITRQSVYEGKQAYTYGVDLLYIPSVEDAFRHFFVEEFSRLEQDDESDTISVLAKLSAYMAEIRWETGKDGRRINKDCESLKEFINNVIRDKETDLKIYRNNSGDKAAQARCRKANELISSGKSALEAMVNIPYLFQKMEECNQKTETGRHELEEWRTSLSSAENAVKSFFNRIRTEYYGGDTDKMTVEIPALAKLFPGLNYDRSKLVLCTMARTNTPFQPFGSLGNSTICEPLAAMDTGETVIFCDECDLFCSSIISLKVDAASEAPPEILRFYKIVGGKTHGFNRGMKAMWPACGKSRCNL